MHKPDIDTRNIFDRNKERGLDVIKPELLNDIAQYYAEQLVNEDRLKTHQLRNVFSAIELIRSKYKQKARSAQRSTSSAANTTGLDADVRTQLIFIKPKMAYAAGRHRSISANFYPLVEQAINAVIDEKADANKAIVNFFTLMESVVAYHKYYESQKS
jgi:CRISPR type III-A-associated protein Csm2